jgi:hypothetical protein
VREAVRDAEEVGKRERVRVPCDLVSVFVAARVGVPPVRDALTVAEEVPWVRDKERVPKELVCETVLTLGDSDIDREAVHVRVRECEADGVRDIDAVRPDAEFVPNRESVTVDVFGVENDRL